MKLKEYLEKNEITQAQLAEKVGCSLGMMSSLVNGKRTPSIHMARRIEKATEYEVLVWDFMAEHPCEGEKEVAAPNGAVTVRDLLPSAFQCSSAPKDERNERNAA